MDHCWYDCYCLFQELVHYVQCVSRSDSDHGPVFQEVAPLTPYRKPLSCRVGMCGLRINARPYWVAGSSRPSKAGFGLSGYLWWKADAGSSHPGNTADHLAQLWVCSFHRTMYQMSLYLTLESTKSSTSCSSNAWPSRSTNTGAGVGSRCPGIPFVAAGLSLLV